MSSQGKQPTAGTGARQGVERPQTEEPSTPEKTESRGIDKNQAFDALRNSRRRAAITCLRANGGSMSVEDLTRCVAAEEYDLPPEELSSAQYKRVYTGLYQCHLDRLDDLNVVEFDSDENQITLREEAAQLDPFLDVEDDSDSARAELGFSVSVAAIVSLGILDVGPIGAVPTTLLAVLTIVALLGLALYQRW